MGVENLCPCFKQHYPILVNPIKNYPKLLQYDEPESEPEPEESTPQNDVPNPVPGNPQNSHPPVNIVNHEAQNVEIAPHNDNQVNAQAMEPPYEEENIQERANQNNAPKNDENNNEPKQDHSQNAMYSSNNPAPDTKFGTSNNNEVPGDKESDNEGLSFLDEEGDSLFSSGFDDSFEINKKPVQNANPSKFRFS